MHQYQLQLYKGIGSRYRCPQCQHRRKTLTLYIHTQTNQHLSPNVGKCDREIKCGYHYTPKQYFAENSIAYSDRRIAISRPNIAIRNTHISLSDTIPNQILTSSLSQYDDNNLVHFLTLRFGWPIVKDLIKRYYIGTSKHWHGATVFWQVDGDNNIRGGKIMLYNATNAKRIKLPFNHITWVHTALKLAHYKLTQCFFGEHLLHDNTWPVAIVESEKTALIASIYMPHMVWLASGSLNNITVDKCAVLQGREVLLFPDVNGLALWQAKANELDVLCNISVSTLLEDACTPAQKAQGLDLADYLMG